MSDLNIKLSRGIVQLGYNVPGNYACSNQATHADIVETWVHSDAVPTEDAILAAYDVWVTEQEKLKYRHERLLKYPALHDQLDMIYHAIDAGKLDKTSDFYKEIKKVKDANPKP